MKIRLPDFETHLHVESERQTEIQVASLYKRPGFFVHTVDSVVHPRIIMSKSSHNYVYKTPAMTRFDTLVGSSFSRLSMRIFLLRARSTSPHTSMFVKHTPLGLSQKDGCLHRPNSGLGERGSIPELVEYKGAAWLSLAFSFTFVLLPH